jgi:hypothetical protein
MGSDAGASMDTGLPEGSQSPTGHGRLRVPNLTGTGTPGTKAPGGGRLRVPKLVPSAGSPLATLTIEAEALLPSARVAGGGAVSRQSMKSFGGGWGGDAQLFWQVTRSMGPFSLPKPFSGSRRLTLRFDVPRPGTYQVLLEHTVAADYANARVSLDGKPRGELRGYAPTIGHRTLSLGISPLGAGSHELAIEVIGRDKASSGSFVGLDRIQLKAVDTKG